MIKKKIDKKFDIKQEIIDCNKYLEKIDINAHSYLRYFKREEPPSEKEDINSLDELEKKFYNISKKINRSMSIALEARNSIIILKNIKIT